MEREGIVNKVEVNGQKVEIDDKEELNKKENGKIDGLEVNVISNWLLVFLEKVGRLLVIFVLNIVDIQILVFKYLVFSMDEEEEGEILVEE